MSEASPVLYVYHDNESVLASWARDTFSFAGLVGSAVALNTLMPPSGWLNFTLGVAWILWLAGRGAKLRMRKTPAEARVWLDERFGPEPTPAAKAA